jgi:hypothetical protein
MLIGFVVTGLAASLMVEYLRATSWQATRDIQAPGVQNEVIIERYVFDGREKDVVLVGSSVSTRLPPEGLRPEKVATLFMQDDCGMTGLETIIRSGAVPRIVLIETNFLFKGCDYSTVNNILDPRTFWFRKHFRALRYEFNLVNLVHKKALRRTVDHNDVPKMTPSEWDAHLASQIAFYKEIFLKSKNPPNWFEKNLGILKSQVATLSTRGSRIVFFFTPVHRDLVDLPIFKDWNDRVVREFGGKYKIIYPKPDQYVYLVDGIHFLEQSGKEYFEYLMQQIERVDTVLPMGINA